MSTGSYRAIFRLAVHLSAGRVIQLPDVSGATLSVGPYRTACGDWPALYAAFVGPDVWPVYDAFEGAALLALLASPSALEAWFAENRG